MGVDLATFARRWGRTGVLALVFLCACASTESAAPSHATSPLPVHDVVAAAEVSADRAILPPPAVFNGPPPTAAPPTWAAAPAPTGAGVWAVVVGIDDYPGSGHDLEYARNDASDMDAVLAADGVPATQRIDLTDGQATAATIERALDWLVGHAGPDATAVFFYAGHVRKLAPTTEAIVGADGGLVRDVDVATHLRSLRAGHTWLVMAGCYGGGFTEALAPGRILTAAAPADALAYETSTYHRSYLDEYLIRRGMLQGLGGPSVQSAFAYAADALRREHPDRMPVEYDDGTGPLVLRAPSLPPPRPQPGPSPTSTTAPPRRPAPTTTSTTTPPRSQQQCIVTAGSWVRCPDSS